MWRHQNGHNHPRLSVVSVKGTMVGYWTRLVLAHAVMGMAVAYTHSALRRLPPGWVRLAATAPLLAALAGIPFLFSSMSEFPTRVTVAFITIRMTGGKVRQPLRHARAGWMPACW